MTCPKCGSGAGWKGPTYKSLLYPKNLSPINVEKLAFECLTCSYVRYERTKDEPPPPPPPNTKIRGGRTLPIRHNDGRSVPTLRCRWFGHAPLVETADTRRLLRCELCRLVLGEWESVS